MIKEVTIDGKNFSTLAEFYNEVGKKLGIQGFDSNYNLDTFNDVLYGGFGILEPGENIKLIWKNSKKSEEDLGYRETLVWLNIKLRRCHPSGVPSVKNEIKMAESGKGRTLFQIILEIIQHHDKIQLSLE